MPRGVNNRKTREQKLLQGTYNPTRDQGELPIGHEISGVPPTPKRLGELGSKVWVQLCNDFIVSGLLQTVDLVQLEILVFEIERYWEVQDYLCTKDLHAMETEYKKTQMYFKNMQSQAKSLSESIRKKANDFGMSPAGRRGLLVQPKETYTDPIVEAELIG